MFHVPAHKNVAAPAGQVLVGVAPEVSRPERIAVHASHHIPSGLPFICVGELPRLVYIRCGSTVEGTYDDGLRTRPIDVELFLGCVIELV